MMTKDEKKAWDQGFFAHDAGKGREEIFKINNHALAVRFGQGWDLAHQTKRNNCSSVKKEDKK